MFREMPVSLWQELAFAGLVLVKGDVNYRRLLDDRHWPPPPPGSRLRLLPDAVCGAAHTQGRDHGWLATRQAQALQVEDPTWLINGKRGLIQLVVPADTPGSKKFA